MENINRPLVNLGLIFLAGMALNAMTREEKDTVNYILYYKGRKVYHGICLKQRLTARLREHERAGKCFDEYDCGAVTTYAEACRMEEMRVYRDQTKYNVQYR